MRTRQLLGITALICILSSAALSQTRNYDPSQTFLRNKDVLEMVSRGLTPAAIVNTIATSPCRFDIFPSVLRELRMRGVSDLVLQAMLDAPNGPPSIVLRQEATPSKNVRVTIPNGTVIKVEAAYTVSSETLQKGDRIAFLVARPVYVDGLLVVARNALATGRVVDVRPAQKWGRGGMLAWDMENIVAVDGTRIPVNVSGGSTGKNRVPVLVAGAAVTAAIIFPYTSPVALVWAFKKGEDAKLFGSQSINAAVKGDVSVASALMIRDFPFPYATTLKAISNSFTASSLPSGNNGFLPSGSFLPGGSFLPTSSFGPQR